MVNIFRKFDDSNEASGLMSETCISFHVLQFPTKNGCMATFFLNLGKNLGGKIF